jgi:alpha-N-arabinofuranosidase
MNHIKIDLERILSDIDRNIFGGYFELGCRDTNFPLLDMGSSPYADKNALRSDVRASIERMNIPNIRFGGNFFSGYHWMDGVGPREKRPARHDLAWDCTVPNNFGTNEFVRLCHTFNMEPYLNVNCGDGDMREAADWVEYCNGKGDTALANMRREHGFREPHKVKYWGIGNEVDGPWQIGFKTPYEYARAFTEFAKVMKRTDPSIKLIASAVSLWEDHPTLFKSEWVERAQLMLEQAGDHIDYMAFHRYAHPALDDPFETYMASAASYNEHLTAYEGLISAVSLERGIKHNIAIAVDEWGIIRTPGGLFGTTPINVNIDELGFAHLPDVKATPFPSMTMIINLEDALVTALHLNAFIRHAASIRMANFTATAEALGIDATHPEKPVLLPTFFYPFELYNRTCGQLALDVSWYGETFAATYRNRAYKGVRTLDVAATLDEAKKRLVVYVVNQSEREAMETTISLTTGEFTGSVQVSVVNGPDIKAENTDEKPNQVVTRQTAVKAAGKSFTFTFEPHSVTALVCAVK